MSPLPRRGDHQGARTAEGLRPLQGHREKAKRFIEREGLLAIALLAALILLAIASAAVWGAVLSAVWIGRL